jgi:micrococcal nuclease
MVFGKEVTVPVKTADRYGRIVGVVILPDGKNLNWEFVDAGLAWWYRRYASDDGLLERLEAETREAKRGLWVDKNAIPPWESRRIKR